MTDYVYFIQAAETGRIKIGHSRDPLKRLAALQTAASEDLTLLGVIEGGERLERRLHAMHEQYRLRGEWFRPGDGLLSDIQRRLGVGGPTPAQTASMEKAEAATQSLAQSPAEMKVSTSWGRIGAHTSWANTKDRTARTAPARAALDQKFLTEAGGDPVRAQHLRKAYFARLALKSAQARRARKAGA